VDNPEQQLEALVRPAKELAMTEYNRESGIRIPKENHRPSEIDKKAAENKRPKSGTGLTQSTEDTNEKTRQSDQAGTMSGTPQSDAKGAKAKSRADGSNDGVASADPRVLSGKKSGDATFKHTYRGIDKE
jgi:hypothetical protein